MFLIWIYNTTFLNCSSSLLMVLPDFSPSNSFYLLSPDSSHDHRIWSLSNFQWLLPTSCLAWHSRDILQAQVKLDWLLFFKPDSYFPAFVPSLTVWYVLPPHFQLSLILSLLAQLTHQGSAQMLSPVKPPWIAQILLHSLLPLQIPLLLYFYGLSCIYAYILLPFLHGILVSEYKNFGILDPFFGYSIKASNIVRKHSIFLKMKSTILSAMRVTASSNSLF